MRAAPKEPKLTAACFRCWALDRHSLGLRTWARETDTPLDEATTTTVEWNLEPREDGGTTLHLRETGFVRPEDRQDNDDGWDKELGELVAYLES